jgi:hypothetical protein
LRFGIKQQLLFSSSTVCFLSTTSCWLILSSFLFFSSVMVSSLARNAFSHSYPIKAPLLAIEALFSNLAISACSLEISSEPDQGPVAFSVCWPFLLS